MLVSGAVVWCCRRGLVGVGDGGGGDGGASGGSGVVDGSVIGDGSVVAYRHSGGCGCSGGSGGGGLHIVLAGGTARIGKVSREAEALRQGGGT